MSNPATIPLSIHTETLPGGITFNMIKVKGGEFTIGDEKGSDGWEKPVHQASVDDFYIGQHLISQQIWREIMDSKPSHWQGDARPVEKISWEDAQEFIAKLNQILNLSGEKAYRLPTSAEWEFAARGGIYALKTPFSGGDDLHKLGWYDENSTRQTHPLALKIPNELGLYDMSGNLLEWCQDWYGSDYYQDCLNQGLVKNPTGPKSGSYRVLRGGSWYGIARSCGVGIRYGHRPDARGDNIGFRLSRTGL